MAKTLDNLVDEVRLMLKDRRAGGPYRYTNTDVLESINSGFRELKRLRPDAYLGCCTDDGGVALPSYVEADLAQVPATPFPLDEIFFMALVFYAVGKLQLGDDEFAIDNRAMTLLGGFRQSMLGG